MYLPIITDCEVMAYFYFRNGFFILQTFKFQYYKN